MAYKVAGPGYLKLLDAVRKDQSTMLEGHKGSSVIFFSNLIRLE